MTTALAAFIERTQSVTVPHLIRTVAERFAAGDDVAAVLFYGSILRTGDLDGVLDFYVLTRAAGPAPLVWPTVHFHEFAIDGHMVRAKVATMPLAVFARAAAGATLDTTIWARFVQPSVLLWSVDDTTRNAVIGALAAAAATAAAFAAALGPDRGSATDFWRALFRETYRAEFRVEAPGREGQIVAFDPDRYAALLPLAWDAAGIAHAPDPAGWQVALPEPERRRLRRRWASRRTMGKPLNVARLVRAVFTFEGAARYALWKIERHTGVALALTPWRERHPILAAPGVLWQVWRTRR